MKIFNRLMIEFVSLILSLRTEELEVENENLKKELEENKRKFQETDSQL